MTGNTALCRPLRMQPRAVVDHACVGACVWCAIRLPSVCQSDALKRQLPHLVRIIRERGLSPILAWSVGQQDVDAQVLQETLGCLSGMLLAGKPAREALWECGCVEACAALLSVSCPTCDIKKAPHPLAPHDTPPLAGLWLAGRATMAWLSFAVRQLFGHAAPMRRDVLLRPAG